MLTKEQVIAITRKNCDEDKADPFYGCDEVGTLSMDEYMRVCQAVYRQAVEDAALICTRKWNKEDSFDAYECGKEIRKLGEL